LKWKCPKDVSLQEFSGALVMHINRCMEVISSSNVHPLIGDSRYTSEVAELAKEVEEAFLG